MSGPYPRMPGESIPGKETRETVAVVATDLSDKDAYRCHSCWIRSRLKEVSPDRAGISSLIDVVKAKADSDVSFEELE